MAVYISDRVRHIRRSDLEHEGIESVWLEIRQRANKPLLVCNLYRPPSSSSSYLESIRVMLESALNEGKEVAVLGDLNLNLLREASASSVENMATDLNLFQLMSEPTRETETSSSLIDLLLASDPGNFNRTGIAPVALSDHHMIYGSRSEDVALNQHSFRMGRCYAKCDRTKFLSDLKTAQWSTLDSIDDINTRWHGWKKLFLKIMDSHVPVKKM